MGIGILHRELAINWSEAHVALRRAVELKVKHPGEVLDTDKGWSYVTFFRPGTQGQSVLFDIDRLEALARDNGYFLPWEVVTQHNKIVITAHSEEYGPSAQLFGLHAFLEAYAAKFSNSKKYPEHGFYGKLGGFFDRPEKGRVLVIYSTSNDTLLTILGSVEELLPHLKVKGIRFEHDISNGLSNIPRMLDGFKDQKYRDSGTQYYRITNPNQFSMLLEQARNDYFHYPFTSHPE